MSKDYLRIDSEIHSAKGVNWLEALKACAINNKGVITRKTYTEYLPDWLSTDKIRYALSKMESQGMLKREGMGKGRKYIIAKLADHIDL